MPQDGITVGTRGRCLVTGANGFIGAALCARLEALGRGVERLGSAWGGVENPANLEALPDSIGHVFHLAARTFVPRSWEDPAAFLRTNVDGTGNVLEFCRARGIGLTYVSAYLYGQPDTLPIPEDHPLRPNNPYALSKHLAEQLCAFYAGHYQVPVTVLRPFNVYGPGQAEPFLIPEVVRKAREEERILVQDLAPRRDYVFVDDVVAALVLAMERGGPFGVYNVGSGASVSVGEVVAQVQRALGTTKEVVSANAERRNEISDVVADVTRAERDLGWRPRVDFASGIARTAGGGGRKGTPNPQRAENRQPEGQESVPSEQSDRSSDDRTTENDQQGSIA